MEKDIQQLLDLRSSSLGYSRWGHTPLKRPLTFEFYKNWIHSNHHGDMDYLEKHAPIKENPEIHFKPLKSVLSFSFPYSSIPSHSNTIHPFKQLRISLYAQGYDYHLQIKFQLENLCLELKEIFPDEIFQIAIDSSPLMERDYGKQSGQGWFGKNTCLIDRKSGSLFFLAEILTTLEFSSRIEISPDFCGTCNQCIEICPTKAITNAHHLEATKCISYLTIESKSLPTLNLRKQIGDWFFGCDLCQTICPWNKKILKTTSANFTDLNSTLKSLNPLEESELIEDLRFILTSSNKKLQKILSLSPLLRARATGLKRNAILVSANRKIRILSPEIKPYLKHSKLGELAEWALLELSTPEV